jgi:cell division protein FtsL
MQWFRNLKETIQNTEGYSELKSGFLKNVINGNILTGSLFRKQYLLIITIVIMMIFYIDNRYTCETQLARSIELRNEIQDLKYESMTISAELMELSRRTNVIKMVKERGLELIETTTPPITINDSSTEK